MVPNLGYEPRPPKRAGFKPAAYTFRQKGMVPAHGIKPWLDAHQASVLSLDDTGISCVDTLTGAHEVNLAALCLLHHTSGHCSGAPRRSRTYNVVAFETTASAVPPAGHYMVPTPRLELGLRRTGF